MKHISKQDIILEAIIKAYLEDNLPIGSAELQSKMSIDISASTIRSYFKRLCNEGVLMQLHISGGRIPTPSALKKYWVDRLNTDTTIVLENLSHLRKVVRSFGFYCALEFHSEETLEEVIAIKERYLLLVFSSGELTISYSAEALRFLNELLGFNVYDIRSIANKVGFNELRVKLDRMLVGKVLFEEGDYLLHEIARESEDEFYDSFKNTKTMLDLKDGIYFEEVVPSGYMAVKQKAKIEGDNAKILCLGRLNWDFEGFFNKAKEKHGR